MINAMKISSWIIVISVLMVSACASEDVNLPYTATIGNEVKIRTDVSKGFAKTVGKRFGAAYETYKKLIPLKTKRSRPFIVTIFKKRADFLEYQRRVSPTESDAGFYVPERGELAMRYNGATQTLRLLYHEAFHAFFEDRIIRPPAWLNEGMAQYVESIQYIFGKTVGVGKFKDKWISTLARMNRKKTIPHVRDIVSQDWPNRHALSNEEYALSWSLISFFYNGGEEHTDKFKYYLNLLYNKKNPRKAFFEVWPDVDTLDAEWKKYMRSSVLKRRFLKLIPGV